MGLRHVSTVKLEQDVSKLPACAHDAIQIAGEWGGIQKNYILFCIGMRKAFVRSSCRFLRDGNADVSRLAFVLQEDLTPVSPRGRCYYSSVVVIDKGPALIPLTHLKYLLTVSLSKPTQ